MKRLGSSDSLGAFISIPSAEEKSIGDNHVYSRGFQYMLEEEEYGEESGQSSEKKRRLSVNQVKALEKNFDVENKLEPERKVKLAEELGLQPRQVAVWFQNRRARGKTKQLERDYGLLKANYDELKLQYDALQHDKEALLAELRELKSKIHGETSDKKVSIKEENVFLPETEDRAEEQSKISTAMEEEPEKGLRSSLFKELKEGSSDSDSSAILNEDNSPKAATSSSAIFQQHHLMMSPSASSTRFNCSSSSLSPINCLSFSDSKVISVNTQKAYQHQFERMEELNFFSGEESCNFFSDDQAPTLQWYCSDQWN